MGKARKPRSPALTGAVCTRGRPDDWPEGLRRALASLSRQSRPLAEILIIDNAPGDDRVRVLVEREFPEVRYLEESMAGLGFARNRALSAAIGDVVAFLDDDAVADRGWAAALLAPFRDDYKVAAVTGRVVGGFPHGPRGEQRLRVATPSIARVVGLGGGCSLAVQRWRILRQGGFDESLDRACTHDALWRLLTAGWAVQYEPAAVAGQERPGLGQEELVAFLAKSFLDARGPGRLGLLAFLAWQLARPVLRLRPREAAQGWRGLRAWSSGRERRRPQRAT